LLGVALAMGAIAVNSLPLYRLFSQVTGYGGTPRVARAAPATATRRTVTVRFDANVAPDMPWAATPPAPVNVRLGDEMTVFYVVRNIGTEPTLATTTYNVTPFKVGQYFDTVDCFCSGDHVLLPGEEKQLGVTFFVDPKMATDRNAEEVGEITLSFTYFNVSNTFFKVRPAKADRQ
jgi:cytochrome c oxidase assembly protein subunit 11